MIYDSIHNLDFYLRTPLYMQIKEYLLTLDKESEDGTRDFGNYKVIVSSYVTEYSNICESHEEMDDIHMVLAGQEAVEYYRWGANRVKLPYDKDKDVTIFYKDAMPTITNPLTLGYFCYLKAGEVHSPAIPYKIGSSYVKKVVVKIPTQKN